MNAKAVALTLLILHLIILAIICWTWYNMNTSDFAGEMTYGIASILLLFSTIYYFALTVWTYILFKKGNQNRNIVLQILVIVAFSAIPPMYLLL